MGGLLGGRIIRQVPKGLVNLNYDIHICVHMGTELLPEETAYPPTAISYPDNDDQEPLDEESDPAVAQFKTESSCDAIGSNNEIFDFQSLRQALNLSEPVAVNYFTQKFNEFVEN